MSGGVRNLRAMFENKDQSTSPPDTRGRSPAAGSTGAHSTGASPRPLSKVRTSFVAVEKSGQIGLKLRRETSGEPSMAKRRESFSIDEEDQPEATAERKDSLAAEIKARQNSAVIGETIPESAVETPPIEVDNQLGDKGKEARNGDPEDKKPVAIASSGAKTWSGTSNGHTSGSTKSVAAAKKLEQATASRTTARPAPISTAKTSTAPKTSPKIIRSPAMPKTPTTPSRSHTKETHTRKPEKKPSHTSKPTAKPPTTAARGSSPKTRIQPSPPQSGFVKPRPKSPTRPVKLPASLTAHTASSGSKTSTAPQPTSRQSLSRGETSGSKAVTASQPSSRQSLSRGEISGAVQPTHSLQSQSRSPSRINKPSSTIARQTSTLNKSSRPSLGPPPGTLKKQSSRQSLPHQGTAPDDSFLARMMRPTTSSASKTADPEKAPPQKVQAVKRPAAKEEPVKNHAIPATSTTAAKSAKTAAVSKPSPAPKPASKDTGLAASVATKHEAAKATVPKVVNPTESGSVTKVNVPEVKEEAVESKIVGPGLSEANDQRPEAEEAKVAEDVMEVKSTEPLIEESCVDDETSSVVEPTQEKEEKLEPKLETIEEASEAKTEKKAEPVYDESKSIPAIAEDVPSTKVEPIAPVEQAEVSEETTITSKTELSKPKEAEVAIAPKPSPVKGEVDVQPKEAKAEITPEPEKVKTPPAPKEVKLVTAEDPEDVKAREEIAKLNAEVLQSAGESTHSA